MTMWLILKALVVLFFLVMFLRRPNWVWGIGLLTMTTAVLLDTFLGTFGREQTAVELGYFFYVINGILVGGTALWFWGLFYPLVHHSTSLSMTPSDTPVPATAVAPPAKAKTAPSPTTTAFDRQMLYDTIRQQLGREDILNLLYDLNIPENDILTLDQDMPQLIIRLMDYAIEHGKAGELALAVERILTPIPTENLPRLEKISTDSPLPILRHYLLAHYSLTELKSMTLELNIDWETIGTGNKASYVRDLLLYLQRRNRLDELIDLMKRPLTVSDDDDNGEVGETAV